MLQGDAPNRYKEICQELNKRKVGAFYVPRASVKCNTGCDA